MFKFIVLVSLFSVSVFAVNETDFLADNETANEILESDPSPKKGESDPILEAIQNQTKLLQSSKTLFPDPQSWFSWLLGILSTTSNCVQFTLSMGEKCGRAAALGLIVANKYYELRTLAYQPTLWLALLGPSLPGMNFNSVAGLLAYGHWSGFLNGFNEAPTAWLLATAYAGATASATAMGTAFTRLSEENRATMAGWGQTLRDKAVSLLGDAFRSAMSTAGDTAASAVQSTVGTVHNAAVATGNRFGFLGTICRLLGLNLGTEADWAAGGALPSDVTISFSRPVLSVAAAPAP